MKIELPREIKDIIVVLLERVFGIGIFTRRFEIHAHCIYIGGGGDSFFYFCYHYRFERKSANLSHKHIRSTGTQITLAS